MEQEQKPKWQRDIEQILQRRMGGSYLEDRLEEVEAMSKHIDMAFKLVKIAGTIEKPAGELEKAVAPILTAASEELSPLAAVYTAFRIGIAYERYQNADRA